ncbi:MAG: bifunctional adenosylcobinamide kinase/adenosylcobinamide-phosphate guanylyltransferase [Clostridia bacterium]|nr:bifunctional adenosylcobinamide kinase/adenosylcobinamide-phosphate guanylyltransferase [Clostridia bacterium]
MSQNKNNKLILVTGGARSGKSTFAEKIAAEMGKDIAYIATAIPFDEGMKQRIKKHKQQRPSTWETFEVYRDIYKTIKEIKYRKDCIVLDCITLMITNLMIEETEIDWENMPYQHSQRLESYIKDQTLKLIQEVKTGDCSAILVTNEVGCGIVPDNNMSIIFRDISGRINQMIARQADEVYLLSCGIPVRIK